MSTPNESIQLTLNGEPYAMTAGLTAADLVEQLGLGGRRIAVEINEQIVPRANWPRPRWPQATRSKWSTPLAAASCRCFFKESL